MSHKVSCVCKYCGGQFEVYESVFNNNRGIFCSRPCASKYKSIKSKGKYFHVNELKKICTIPIEAHKLAYLAGIIDGEGSIILKKSNHNFEGVSPAVLVTNTDFKLLDWLSDEIKGSRHSLRDSNMYENRLSMEGVTFKLGFVWKISTLLDCRDLLNALLPYLIIKHDNAITVLDYCNRAIDNHESKLKQFKNGQLSLVPNISNRQNNTTLGVDCH